MQRADERYLIEGAGWTGRCCFSYDQHYDPANVSFGILQACNEFVLEPGGHFGLHRHVGIDIVTVVLQGTLTHVRSGGVELRDPGVYVTSAAAGIEHDERNDGTIPVRFLQAWLLPGDSDPKPWRYDLAAQASAPLEARDFVFVTAGEAVLDGVPLGVGDSARLNGSATLSAPVGAEVLVWSC